MRDIEDELAEIKREIIESRALVIKATNQTSAFGSDLRSIGKRQQQQDRRMAWNGVAAYALFIFAVFTVVKVAWDARVDAVKADAERKGQEADRLKKELSDIRKRDEDRARGELRLAQYTDLVRQNKRPEIVEGYEAARREPMTRSEEFFFQDAYERARTELAMIHYEQGRDKMRAERYQEAATFLEQSIKVKADSANATAVKLALALAYRKLKRQKDAIPLLLEISHDAVDKDLEDDAVYQLAYCNMEIEAWNDAKNAWRDLIRRFPDSHFAGEAKMVLASLNLLH